MSEPGFALQKAVIAALRADGAVQALLGTPARVYDEPPPDTLFPYVTLGAARLASWDTVSDTGHEHVFTLHVWSRYGGRREVRLVLGALYDVLHNAALSVDGHHIVILRFDFSDIFRDEEGETAHGIARFRALTEPVVAP